MTADADEFVQDVRRSGLAGESDLDAALGRVPDDERSDAERVADYLVDAEVLTHYQAVKLMRGQWQGLVVKQYHVLAPLGRGGMATVYLARDASAGRLVALKILSAKRAKKDETLLARFRREMKMCQQVDHPHLTKTYDSGLAGDTHYIAMEYIRGRTLGRHIREEGPASAERVARLFAEAAKGLHHAHAQGVIHRDLKPSNIMVTPNLHAKILDLGLALMEGDAAEAAKEKGGPRVVVGTMDYIAPEQTIDSERVGPRADLYSLGCSMYYALTGQAPFPGGTGKEKVQKHRHEVPEEIGRLNPTVPLEFAVIVEKLMSKRPRDRYASAAELRQDLKPWAAGDPPLPLDLTPEQSDRQTLREVEADQEGDRESWDAVPLMGYRATATEAGEKPGRPKFQRRGEDTTMTALWAALLVILALVLTGVGFWLIV